MKTILGFDSWTEGAHHYERVAEALYQQGYQLLLVHIGSWGHDIREEKEERRGILILRDINYYDGLRFPDILKKEKPKAVVFLSTTSVAHRAFNRYCTLFRIPTIHLYHGLVSVQSTDQERLNPVNWKAHIKTFGVRIKSNLFQIYPMYFRTLVETKASFNDWFWVFKDVFLKLAAKNYSGESSPDASTSKVFVYVNADIKHAIKRYRVNFNQVKVLGNPDLIKFNIDQSLIGLGLKRNYAKSNTVIYFDNGLIDIGAVFRDANEYAQHLKITRNEILKFGFNLKVKLHPVQYRTGLIEILEELGIETISNEDFINWLKTCRAVISEPSSIAILPGLLGKPLFLARYYSLVNQEYGDLLKQYPRAKELFDLKQLKPSLDEIESNLCEEQTVRWIQNNVGPLPASSFQDRFAQEMIELISAYDYSFH